MSAAISKLKVDGLRSELNRRGLDTAGIKPILVKRLEEALKKEEEEMENKNEKAVAGKKRRRELTEENGHEASENLRSMSLKELRDVAKNLGLATNGSKRELVERISAVDDGNMETQNDNVGAEETEESKKEKVVTVTKKGGAILDQWLPDTVKSRFHVLQQGEEFYDAMLNQTNVGENNNKFFVIQALESDDGGTFMVYNRWGRVGAKGQDKLHGPYTLRDRAISEFEMKFFDKTKNDWSERRNFKCYPKRYVWLEMDYDEPKKATATVQSEPRESIGKQLQESKLEPRVARFVSLICNISMMQQQMLEIGYNAEKLPLGKLSKSTILKGYDVLRKISEVIGQSERKKLEQLSGEFYTVIPHDFGFKKMRDFVIDTPYKLKSKLDMVAALGEIEVATKMLGVDVELQDDPLYYHYRCLHCDLAPVEVDSEEFSMIQKYMENTHAKTHSNYKVDIVQVFKVSREGENERFSEFRNIKNRMLLWHGSRLSNWMGILSQGLRIAPPEAPVTGYMFGKGVYFADMFSKSANYCCASRACTTGVLLLCEVALGDMAELLTANYHADKLPAGKLSTKGVGATAPDMSESMALEDGLTIPLGRPKEQAGPKGSLLCNEYIVYNAEQIRMRYVIQVNFNFEKQ